MSEHSIAETYPNVLAFFEARVRFYSGQHWTTESAHDPGLTTLQLLANAVALLEEEYRALADGPSIFKGAPYSPWQPVLGKEGRLHFKPHFTAPVARDFETPPAVSEDIRRMAEAVPGVMRAWVDKGKSEKTALVLEFAAVMPGVKKGDNNKEKGTYEQRKQVFRSVFRRLQEGRGLCQPVLPVREAIPLPLALRVVLRCAFRKSDGNSAQKINIPAKIAAVMAGVGNFLHSGSHPKTCFQPADLLARLSSSLGDVTAVQCGTVINGPARVFSGHERVMLSEGKDLFRITRWRFTLEHGGHVRDARPDEVRMAAYLYAAQSVREAWTGQWFEPAKPIDRAEAEGRNNTALSDSARVERMRIHRQFPICYNLDSKDGKPDVQALQMQGWLFLFEQLLANMAKPLESPDRYFQRHPLAAADFVGTLAHPLLSKLSATKGYQEALAAMTAGDAHFSQLPKTLLLHLAALQGEEAWMGSGAREAQSEVLRDEAGIAFWLRRLAYCNGNRLSDGKRLGVGRLELGGGILEERLAMLLRPLTPLAAKLAQRYFDMRFAINPLTGEEEFRCYILDSEGAIRIVCDVMSPSPEEAERVALMALRFAGLSGHYTLDGEKIRIGWLAKLPGRYSALEAAAGIRECEAWAKSLLPPWVKVLSYEELGEQTPFCLAVLMAEGDVPPNQRDTLTDTIRQHIPAHLYPRIFFLTGPDRKRVDLLLHGPDGSGFSPTHDRFSALRKMLRKYEQAQGVSNE